MTIKTMISIPMLVLAAVAAISVLVSNIVQFSGYIDETVNDLLSNASEAALLKITLYKSRSEIIAERIGKDPAIAGALENRSREILIKRAMHIYSQAADDLTGAWYCTIIDTSGTVIARTDMSLLYGDNLGHLPQFSMLLSGGTFTAIESTPHVRVSAGSGSPIYDSQGRIIGAVIMGFRLDTNEFVDTIASDFGCEVTVFCEDERVATTILSNDGGRLLSTKAPPAVSAKVLAGETFVGRVKLMGYELITKYEPLLNHSGKITGMLFVGCYVEKEAEIIKSFIRVGLIFAFMLLLISFPIITVIAKRIASPMNDASKVLSAFSDGNFDARLEGSYKGDWTILQNSINETGIKLSAYLKEKIQDDKIKELAAIVAIAGAGVVVMDKDGIIRVWNKGAEDILGYTPEEMIGRTTHYITPEDRHKDIDIVAARLARGEHIAHIRVMRKHKNGRLVESSVSWTPIIDNDGTYNGSAAIFHDITAEVHATNKVKNLAAIVSSADAGIIIKDNDFNVIDWNVGAEKILGYTFDEILGKNMSYYATEDNAQELTTIQENLRNGQHIMHTEIVRKHKDGRRIDCSASFTPICDDNGVFTGSVTVFHDISEKKNMEHALEEAVKIAKEASQAKSMFLANMSHEIRTPLNGVMGFAELALDDLGISDQVKDYLNKIKNSADGLLDIINDILDISKIESGRMVLEKIPFNLQDVLKTCQAIIEPKAGEKGIALHFYAEAFNGKKLLGDPTKLRQTLLNLLSNAVKFTNHGTVKVTAVAEDEGSDNALIRFEVIDSGIGMTDEQLNNVFDAFIQADTSTTRKYGGTGLGLALTKKFVEMMGGILEVESRPGLGSTFSFSLPFDTVPDSTAVPQSQSVAPVVERPFFSGEVLVCEDNYMNQELITNHLERIGLNVTIAMNGKQGVICAEKRMKKGKPFDLILMDINMPVMDGLEATRKLIAAGNKTPVIALTANAISSERERYLRYGMSDYLGKPFTSQELWACLLRYLNPVEAKSMPVAESSYHRAAHDSTHDYAALIVNDVLDEALGINRTSGDLQLYRHIQHNFFKDYQYIIETLRELIDAGKIDHAYREAHTLKSTARIIGAEKAGAAAHEVELSLLNRNTDTSGSTSRLTEQITVLENALRQLFTVLAPVIENRRESSPEKNNNELDVTDALALIDALSPLLEAGYTESLHYIDRIRTVFAPLGNVRDELITQMEDYEFDAAFETLRTIKESLL